MIFRRRLDLYSTAGARTTGGGVKPAKAAAAGSFSPLLLLAAALLCILDPRCHVAALNVTSPAPARPVARCNLNAGRWVPNPWTKRYTGFSCQSIRSSFNCQKNGRTNLNYLNYKWSVPGCNIKSFNPAAFLALVRGKVFMSVGDSYGTNFYHALRCLIETTTPVQDFLTSSAFGTGVKATGFTVPSYRFTYLRQTTNFLVDSEPQGSASSQGLWTVYLGRADPTWAKLLPHVHYLLFATGHWFTNAASNTRDYRDASGAQLSLTSLRAMRYAIQTVRSTVESSGFRGLPMFLSYTATHYSVSFPPGGSIEDCSSSITPIGNYLAQYGARHTFFMKARFDLFWMLRLSQFRIIDITRATLYRPDAHMQKYGDESMDCSHWCVPGVPDTWTDIVYSFVAGAIA